MDPREQEDLSKSFQELPQSFRYQELPSISGGQKTTVLTGLDALKLFAAQTQQPLAPPHHPA